MPKAPPLPPPTQIVLVTPLITSAERMVAILSPILKATPIAAVIAAVQAADERTGINLVKSLAGPVQAAGAALIIDGPIDIVARGGADGHHVAHGVRQMGEAIERLKPERMVGVAGLKGRDDAMTAGESGADYVMFGEPLPPREPGGAARLPDIATVVERVGWWAEVFEVPVVGYAPDLDAARALARAGADFVAVGDWILAAEDPASAIVELAATLKGARA
ncbi:MAG: thiamine phosphate synthase [Alphaproteobacteria bacterium]